jgi:hypothetical protein
MTDVILFSEDVLLEQAAIKIIAVENPRLNVSNVMGKRGFGYFQSRIDQIRRSASSLIFIAFLDGDELGDTCPSDAINQWFNSRNPNNIYVRFAFYELESWLLADRANLAAFLNVSPGVLPVVDDQRRNTKELLVQLARRSRRREIVHDLVPAPGLTAIVGPAYNARISEFIRTSWDVRAAATQNVSLARACRCVAAIG